MKLIKYLIAILSSIILFSTVNVQSQDPQLDIWKKVKSEPENFKTIIAQQEAYLNSIDTKNLPEEELIQVKNYYRYLNFWKTRLSLNENGNLSYEPYIDLVQQTRMDPYCSGSDPAQWELLGPSYNNEIQNVGLVAEVLYNPQQEDDYLVSSDRGGLWKSQTSGNSWANVTDDLNLPGLSATEIARNPHNNDHIMVSTAGGIQIANYGMGVIESFDNGNTWSVIETFPYEDDAKVNKVLFDPNDDNPYDGVTVYALGKTKLYVSYDTGATWQIFKDFETLDYPNGNHLREIEITSNGTMFVTSFDIWGLDGRIFKYKNNQWVNLTDQFDEPQKSWLSTPYNGKVFMMVDGYDQNQNPSRRIYKSTDYGETWTQIKYFTNYGPKDEFEYSPASELIYIGDINVKIIKNDGDSYPTYTYIDAGHHDIRDFNFMGINNQGYEEVLTATDGGVSLLRINPNNPNDNNWENLNGNHLPIGDFLGLSVAHDESEKIVGGLVHGYTYVYENGNWNNIAIHMGDGGDCEIDWFNSDSYFFQGSPKVYHNSTYPSSIYTNYNDWFIGMKMKLDPSNPDILYMGRGKPADTIPSRILVHNITNGNQDLINAPNSIKKVGALGVNKNDEIYIAEFTMNDPDNDTLIAKTSDDGQNWENLTKNQVFTNNGNPDGILKDKLKWKAVEDIIFNPHNPDELWISIGGVRNEAGKYRVIHSTDGGDTWYDFSNNLPRYPVQALEYQDGHARLFAGTDAGIYYTEAGSNNWQCFSEGMPICQVTDLDYNPCNNYLYASAYSRATFKTPVDFGDDISDYELPPNEDIVWSSPKEVNSNLIIPGGSSLTITDLVNVAKDAKIVIKPNGNLIIDGGTITNQCNYTWQGIQVWGQADSSQFCISEPCPQGKLEIINGGTIENAEIGVDLWHPDHWNSMGGIVQAVDAVFRNNAKAVHASHYHNYNPYDPGTERDNLSYFTNCTFEITDDYPGTTTFYKHVDLADVRGIDFKGCDFSVNDQVNGVSTWNSGIAAYDAGFGVYSRCTNNTIPCNDYDSCTFTGFYKAISSTATSRTTYNFSVKRSQFTDNVHGVYGGAQSNATVLFNHFAIGPNNTGDSIQCINSAGTGVFIDNASGFAIEENSFEKAQGAPTDNYIGVRIKNTQATDEVYKNDFEGLSYGNFSEGENWEGNSYTGLTYFCNDNTNNYADFYVCGDTTNYDNPGIQSKQGDEELSAGNTFSPSGATWHFYNGAGYLVDYYYCGSCTNEDPDDDKILNVMDTAITIENTCPSHYGDGDEERQVTLTSDERLATEEDYYDNYTNYNNVESLYNDLKDGGSTQAELQTVENAQPEDMWEVRSQLLGDSPHLSMEVLKTTADKTEVFSDQSIFDIMAANPDELKKEELIKYLEEKEEPLPDYMIAILEEVAKGTTYKTVLQQQMARYNRGKARAAHDIIRSILSRDSLNVQDLRNWLDNLGGLAADRQIISTYVQEGDFDNAFTLAEMLPDLYELEGDALEEHGHYMDMLNLYQALEQQGRNTFQLNAQEKQQVEYIASASEGIAGSQAQNILEAVYDEHFYDCPDTEGEEGYKRSGIKPGDLNKLSGISIEAHPNPAKKWAAFDYTLPDAVNQGVIIITNARGKTVEKLPVKGKQGQKLWDTRTMEPGVYFYMLRAGGNIQSGKIVIAR